MFKLQFTLLSIALETLGTWADLSSGYRIKHPETKAYAANEKGFLIS